MAKKSEARETDAVYLSKLLLYLVLGVTWIKIDGRPIVPLGPIVGLILAHQEHFRIDRKIEYLLLLVAGVLGFAGVGIYLAVTSGA